MQITPKTKNLAAIGSLESKDRDEAITAGAFRTALPSYGQNPPASRSRTVFTLGLASLLMAAPCAKATNSFPWGWCTWGAIAEFDNYAPSPGCDWHGDAGTWMTAAAAKHWVTSTATRGAEVNALIVWTNGGAGHVGIVSKVNRDSITVKEMNWGKQLIGAPAGWTDQAGKYSYRDLKFSSNLSTASYKFAGFIYPRKTTPYTADAVLDQQAIQDMKNLQNTNGNFGAMLQGSFGVNKNWEPDFQLRYARFRYWQGALTVFQATSKTDPKLRYTLYWEPMTQQWIGWTLVR